MTELMKRLLVVAVVLFAIGVAIADGKTTLPLSEEQKKLNVESFDYVWTAVRDRHFDPTLGGLDWDAIGKEYRPKVEQAQTMAEARIAMEAMLDRLGESHFGIIPSEAYGSLGETDMGAGKGDGTAGIEARIVDGHAMVTRIDPGSAAEKAGVKTGWLIGRIGNEDVDALLKTWTEQIAEKSLKTALIAGGIEGRLAGNIGDSLAVRFLDGDDKPVDLTLTLAERRGKRTVLGNLPPVYVWIESKKLPGDIGYVRFSNFLNPGYVSVEYNKAMESFLDGKGIIIDVRGNTGGLGGMVPGTIGWLVSEDDKKIGTLYLRGTTIDLLVTQRVKTFSGPVAVLTDCLSASAAEFFSGGLKDTGRAKVFGTRTAGAALAARIDKLPNGDGFMYVMANYVSANGKRLEGVGVIPDVEVAPDRKALLAGRDPVIDAAVKWIEQGGK